jgi:dienelactone hydrolase
MRPILVLFALLASSVAASAVVAQEKVGFAALDAGKGAPATQLDGYLFRPDSAGPHPALVFMHGCSGLISRSTNTFMSREREWQRKLASLGFVVLMVDSFAARGISEMCSRDGFKEWVYLRRPGDAYAGLIHLQSLPFVRRDRIGLLGWSNGGGATLLAIGAGSRARPPGFGGPDFRAAIAFYPASCNEKRLGSSWTTTVPLLILIGQEDVWTPAGPCKALADLAIDHGAPVSFHAYAGAYHDFDWPGLKRRELTAYTTRAGVVPISAEDPAARAEAVQRVAAFLAHHILN